MIRTTLVMSCDKNNFPSAISSDDKKETKSNQTIFVSYCFSSQDMKAQVT